MYRFIQLSRYGKAVQYHAWLEMSDLERDALYNALEWVCGQEEEAREKEQ